MMKKILFTGIVILLTGCGERIIKHMKTKDFEINNNHYINYKYGFEVTIPTNWVFGIENRKDPGIIRLVTLNRNIKGRLRRIGSITFYYMHQEGNESEKEMFLRRLKEIEEDIEIDRKQVEENIDGKFLVSKSIDETNFLNLTNEKGIYFWYFTEERDEKIRVKKGNIMEKMPIRFYMYRYYIPYKSYSSTTKRFFLPLVIGFNEYEDYNFTESEKSNYLQDQLQVIQSFRTFSNFVRDGLPSAKE